MTFSKRWEALRLWREHENKVNTMRKLVFDLMSHPDATDEQIADVRRACINTAKHTRDLKNRLMEKGLI